MPAPHPWRELGPPDLGPGELRGFDLGDRLVLLANLRGRLYALDDWCNHAGCLLSGGWLDGKRDCVVCPCHEYAFRLDDGRNITTPRLCDDQEAFPIKIEGDVVFVQAAPHPELVR